MRKTFKFFILILVVVLSIVVFTSCTQRKDDIIFGTSFSVYLKGTSINREKTIKSIFSYVNDLDPILSSSTVGSDIYNINNAKANEKISCNEVTMENLKIAKQLCDLTNGAFDPSVFPLVKLWGFDPSYVKLNNYKPPKDEDIEDTLALVGLDRAFEIDFENSTVTKKIEGAMLDLGGIAKGYAVDKANDLVSDKYESLLNLGGNISVKNNSFEIKIANPDLEETSQSVVTSLTLNSGECIATSGGYERYQKSLNEDGTYTIYHHILNPKTGRPSDTNFIFANGKSGKLLSASIITDNGALGDAVATAVMVLGYHKGIELINDLELNAVLISKVSGEEQLNVLKIGSKFE